jgi:polysaccharide transporter, PST family
MLGVVARNGAIHGFEQIMNILLGFAATIAVARAFGPEQFGVWTLALFIMRIMMGMTAYGLDIQTVKKCERQDASSRKFLASVVVLRFVNTAALILLTIAVGLVWYGVTGTWPLLIALLAAMAPALILMPFESLEYWFRAGQDAITPAFARISSALTGMILKLALIFIGAGVLSMGWAHMVQVAIPGALLLVMFLLRGKRLPFSAVAHSDVTDIYRSALPLFIAQLGTLAAMRLDIVVLSLFASERDVGLYSASLRICEAVYVLPVVVMTAAAPFLFRMSRTETKSFVKLFHVVLTAFTAASFAIAIVIAILAPWIVKLLFGHSYAEASNVLRIQIFALLGISTAVATEYWWIARRRAKVCMTRTLTGASATLVLSLLLVPWLGAIGAAIANVIATLASGAVIHLALGRTGRHLWHMQIRPARPETWRLAVNIR